MQLVESLRVDPRELLVPRLQVGRAAPQVERPAKRCRCEARVSGAEEPPAFRCEVLESVAVDLCRRGTRAELIGRNIAIDETAEWAGTISYELLTRLGQRFTRLYSGGESLIPEAPTP